MRNKESSDKSGLNACYEKANNTLPEKLPYITYVEAEKAARRIAIKFGKRKYASPTVLWEFSKKPFIWHTRFLDIEILVCLTIANFKPILK